MKNIDNNNIKKELEVTKTAEELIEQDGINKLSELKQSLVDGTIMDTNREIDLLNKSGYLDNKELITNINNSYQKHLINLA